MSALWVGYAEYARSVDERSRTRSSAKLPILLARARRAGTRVLIVLDRVSRWAAVSRQRRQLVELSADARFLNDVGLSRSQAMQEANKPFWKS